MEKQNLDYDNGKMTNRRLFSVKYPFLFDFSFLSIIVAAIIVELKCKPISDCFSDKPYFDIITILLPALLTVTSISLSLMRDKIYGVTIAQFNRLRKNTFYGFLHFIFIVIVIFGFYVAFRFCSLWMSSYVLMFISFVYSIVFAAQQLPVILLHEKYINGVIKRSYKDMQNRTSNHLVKEDEYVEVIILNMIFTKGLDDTYSILKRKDEAFNATLLSYLLDKQNRLLFSLGESKNVLPKNLGMEYEGFNILSVIEKSLANLNQLVKDENNNAYQIKTEHGDYTYLVTRLLYVTHDLCDSLELFNKYNDAINTIVLHNLLIESQDSNAKALDSLMMLMSISTINSNETWFIKFIRDNELFDSAPFDCEKSCIGIFLCVYIAFRINNSCFSYDGKEKMASFLNEKTNSLNSTGKSWKELFLESIDFNKPKEILGLLEKLLDLYDSISQYSFEYYQKDEQSPGASLVFEKSFYKSEIVNTWLSIIVYLAYDMDFEEVIAVIKKMDYSRRLIVVQTIIYDWCKDGSFEIKEKLPYLDYFGIDDYSIKNIKMIEVIKEAFNSLIHDFKYEEINAIIDSKTLELNNMKNTASTKFSEAANDIPFYDKNLSIDKENDSHSFNLKIDKDEADSLFKMFVDRFPSMIGKIVYETVNKNVEPIIIDDYNFSNKQIQMIKDFNPDFMSSNAAFAFDDSGIKKVNYRGIPRLFYGKNGAISVNAIFDMESSFIRYVTTEEVENIINKEYYQMDGGKYRYSRYKNDNNSFLITKEELRAILLKRTVVISLKTYIKVVVDKEKCLYFKIQ